MNDAGISAVHHLSLEADVEFVLAIVHRALDGEIELVEDWFVVLEIENAEGIELVGRIVKVPGPAGFDVAVNVDAGVFERFGEAGTIEEIHERAAMCRSGALQKIWTGAGVGLRGLGRIGGVCDRVAEDDKTGSENESFSSEHLVLPVDK